MHCTTSLSVCACTAVSPQCGLAAQRRAYLTALKNGVHNGEYISKAKEIADGLRSEVHEAWLATTLRKQADGRINLRRPETGTAHRMESPPLCVRSLRVFAGRRVGRRRSAACGWLPACFPCAGGELERGDCRGRLWVGGGGGSPPRSLACRSTASYRRHCKGTSNRGSLSTNATGGTALPQRHSLEDAHDPDPSPQQLKGWCFHCRGPATVEFKEAHHPRM